MLIAEVSEKYNISQEALRYYERIGLIPRVIERKVELGILQRKTAAGLSLLNVYGVRGFLLNC